MSTADVTRGLGVVMALTDALGAMGFTVRSAGAGHGSLDVFIEEIPRVAVEDVGLRVEEAMNYSPPEHDAFSVARTTFQGIPVAIYGAPDMAVVVDEDTGERLTEPLARELAQRIVDVTTERRVRVEAVAR